MSVTDSVTLPSQPTSGILVDTPLGGDGWTAPHSMHNVRIALASAAGGGTNTITIFTDPRWTCLIESMMIRVDSLAAATDFMMASVPNNGARQQVNGSLAILTSLATVLPAAMWNPSAAFGTNNNDPGVSGEPGFIQAVIENVDTETLQFHARIYNFQKMAREATPLPILLASIPRSNALLSM